MGVDIEVWRARIGLFSGGRGGRARTASLTFHKLYTRDAMTTGDTTDCAQQDVQAVQALLICLSVWLTLCILSNGRKKVKPTSHPAISNDSAYHHCSKDTKTPRSIALCVVQFAESAVRFAVTVASVLVLHSLTLLLIMAGDVELNPGPLTAPELTLGNLLEKIGTLTDPMAFGALLKIDSHQLKKIEEKWSHPIDTDRQTRDLFDYIERNCDYLDITWESIADALAKAGEGNKSLRVRESCSYNQVVAPTENQPGTSTQCGSVVCCKKSFPSLKLPGLSDHERKEKIEQLEQESNEMDRVFNELSTNIFESLTTRKVGKNQLVSCVTGINAMKPVYEGPNQCVFRKQRKRFIELQAIDGIWPILSDYFSFFNYELIKHIAKHLGTDEDRSKVDSYEKTFICYAKRRVYECPSEFGSKLSADEDCTDLIIKLDSTYDECNVSHLKDFEMRLSNILQIEDGVMRLCRVYPGCYELTLQVPTLVETIFPLSTKQVTDLRTLGVLFLSCGDYSVQPHSNSENKEDGDDSEDDNSDGGYQCSLPTVFPSSEYEYSKTFLMERLVASHPKKIPGSSHHDSGIGTLSEPKTIRSSEMASVIDEDTYMFRALHFQSDAEKLKSDEPPPLVNPASSKLHAAVFNGELAKVRMLVEVVHCSPLVVNGDGYTGLHVAAAAGNLEMLKYFVEERSINPTSESIIGVTPLHVAAYNGHLHIVKYLVGTQQVDPLCIDRQLRSPLHTACKSGNLTVIKYLMHESQLHQPIDVHDKTKVGNTILHYAALSGNLELVQFLLEGDVQEDSHLPQALVKEKCEVNAKNEDSCTPLMFAAWNGHSDVILTLVKNKADVHLKQENGATALYIASQHEHRDCVELLIQHGGDVNTQDSYSWTPLMWAAYSGYTDIVELLIIHGADVNVKNKNSCTPLMFAAWNGHSDVILTLVKNKADVHLKQKTGVTALYIASECGHRDCVELLIQYGGDVNTQDNTGATALHIASRHGHRDCVDLLIQHGGDVNTQDNYSWAPLMWAAYSGYTDIVEYLIIHGAAVNVKNKDSCTPLMRAAQKGHSDVILTLVKNKADVHLKEETGHTALHIASRHGHRDCVELLIQHGADVNTQTNTGATALYIASLHGHRDCVELLIQHGGDVNTQDSYSWAPLMCAAYSGYTDIVEYLIIHGAAVNVKDKLGDTALSYAKNSEIKDLLTRHNAV